jgi:hypothetical protein
MNVSRRLKTLDGFRIAAVHTLSRTKRAPVSESCVRLALIA